MNENNFNLNMISKIIQEKKIKSYVHFDLSKKN